MLKNLLKIITPVFLIFIIPTIANAVSPFPDVPDYHEYANEINFVKERGIVDGYSDGYFRPENLITRGALTKIVINSKYSQSVINECMDDNSAVFPDVRTDYTFAKYICVAKNEGIVRGYSDGLFRPDDFVTYAQAVKIVVSTLDDELGIDPNSDLNTYVEYLKNKNGTPPTLVDAALDKLVNRGESTFLIQIVMDNYVALPDEPDAPPLGYFSQQVNTDNGNFTVKFIAADLQTSRVEVATGAASDCYDDCPAKPLGQYVQENNAYAGINGSYFCPADYASCADSLNRFGVLVMNKEKVYFNSYGNLYADFPVAVFRENDVEFFEKVSEWGRSTNVNAVFSNYPLLLFDNELKVGENNETSQNIKSNRSFIANKGNIIFIGVNYNVTVYESGVVLKAMGMENAINLDAGGSTALWYEGYKAGPGRNIPNAILFVRK